MRFILLGVVFCLSLLSCSTFKGLLGIEEYSSIERMDLVISLDICPVPIEPDSSDYRILLRFRNISNAEITVNKSRGTVFAGLIDSNNNEVMQFGKYTSIQRDTLIGMSPGAIYEMYCHYTLRDWYNLSGSGEYILYCTYWGPVFDREGKEIKVRAHGQVKSNEVRIRIREPRDQDPSEK